jgi:hypothetical protein
VQIKLLTFLIALFISFPAWGAVNVLYPVGDTKLNPGSANSNYNTSTTCDSFGTDVACVFKFDLTGYTSAEVVSAEFRIAGGVRGYSHNITVSRLLQNITTSQATWNIYSTGNSWGTAGAKLSGTDFTTTNQKTAAAPNSYAWMTIDATQLVKDMIDNNTPQLLLRGASGSMYVTWRMVDYAGTDYDPQLIIRTGTPGQPTTWYVRTDGGTCGLGYRCDGTTDAADPGSGTNQQCACGKPQYLNNLMHGEDIALISAGSYAATGSLIPPSGTSSTLRTKILGAGWNSGCASPPEMWASTGQYNFIDLTGKSNIEIQCLDVTDHVSGANFNRGIFASASSNILLKNVKIHGGSTGIQAGGLNGWDLENVEIYMNNSAGWNGDIGHSGESYNTGTLNFINVRIEYNGCYEDATTHLPINCCSQAQGCYGDGLGTYLTGGIWNFTGCNISHNTSDGLDLLYHDSTTTVNIYRSKVEGNAGNQLKIPNSAHVENSMIVGNCAYFAGQSFTKYDPAQDGRSGTECNYNGVCEATENYINCPCWSSGDGCGTGGTEGDCPPFDNCRALGNTIELSYSNNGVVPAILNNTIVGSGDVIIDTSGTCAAGTDATVTNNIIRGGRSWLDDCSRPSPNGLCGDDSTSIYYDSSANCNSDFVDTYNVCYGLKEGANACNGTGSTDTVDPGFTGVILQGPYSSPGYYSDADYYAQLYISASTGAADETAAVVNSNDYNNFARGAEWDIGGLEYGSTPPAPSCQTDCSQCASSGT